MNRTATPSGSESSNPESSNPDASDPDSADPDPAGRAVSHVRGLIARAAFDVAAGPLPSVVGPVTLYTHQRVAAARVRRALTTHRGALLADAVGLGK